jgi:1-aminocyclopropane-1-carboxylate deaminase
MLPSPLSEIKDEFTLTAGVRLLLKRDDLIHPVISGNKWRKLQPVLHSASEKKYHTVLSFGGPYSNHLHALAFAAKELGLKSIGIVRCEETEALTPTLLDCISWGMQIVRPGRKIFDDRKNDTLIGKWRAEFGDFFLIPDGGDLELAERSCAEILNEIQEPFDHVCCSVGTGTTIRGLALSAGNAQLHGYLCAPGTKVIEAKVPAAVRLTSGFCEGGFAKRSPRLNDFIKWFYQTHHVKLDYVYNGKMMMGIYEELKSKKPFLPGQTIVAIHTGGLQNLTPDLYD